MPKNQYAIARRSIWYLLRTLLVIALIVVLCLTAFVTAMHISNIYILVTEGLELRAGYILQGGEIAPLTEYFTENFIAQDPALYAGTYSSFNVTNFIYKIEVKSLLTLPGDSTATVKVYEKMLSVSGSPMEGTDPEAQLPHHIQCKAQEDQGPLVHQRHDTAQAESRRKASAYAGLFADEDP